MAAAPWDVPPDAGAWWVVAFAAAAWAAHRLLRRLERRGRLYYLGLDLDR